METYLNERLFKLRESLKKEKVEGLLVTNLKNIRYLTGFTGSSAVMVVTLNESVLLTDFRYKEQVKFEVTGKTKVKIFKEFYKDLNATIKKLHIKSIAFEATNLTYSTYNNYKAALSAVKFKPKSYIVEALRVIKDPSEIALMEGAIKIADKGFDTAIKKIQSFLRNNKGVTERDIALAIEQRVKKAGADDHSFSTIVASGARSAIVHASPTDELIKEGEFLLCDMGVINKGYCSDETRTFGVGSLSSKHKKIYKIVKDAHDKALEKIKDGVKISAVDKAGRGIISKAGYGKNFGHGMGHGVGLDIHEAPSLGPKGEDILRTGMVVTIEPGIYIEGFGGVRIEDLVLVTDDGFRFLSTDRKGLLII